MIKVRKYHGWSPECSLRGVERRKYIVKYPEIWSDTVRREIYLHDDLVGRYFARLPSLKTPNSAQYIRITLLAGAPISAADARLLVSAILFGKIRNINRAMSVRRVSAKTFFRT